MGKQDSPQSCGFRNEVMCAHGREINLRAVTNELGCDDWFHADDASLCQHGDTVGKIAAELRAWIDLDRQAKHNRSATHGMIIGWATRLGTLRGDYPQGCADLNRSGSDFPQSAERGCGVSGKGAARDSFGQPAPVGEQPAGWEAEFVCSRCGGAKGEHALGELCDQNDGGTVVRNPHPRVASPAVGPGVEGLTAEQAKALLRWTERATLRPPAVVSREFQALMDARDFLLRRLAEGTDR